MRRRKAYERLRNNPRDVRFSDFCAILEAFGFAPDRQRGSHRLYAHGGARLTLSVQDHSGVAKEYQVRQFLKLVDAYGLRLEE